MTSPSLYSASLYDFSRTHCDTITSIFQEGHLHHWADKVQLIQVQLKELLHLAGNILFEYPVPNNESKADVIILYRGLIFLVVFNVGENEYKEEDIALAHTLAQGLKAHHAASLDKYIVPIVISTCAMPQGSDIHISPEGVFNTMLDNGDNLAALLEHFSNQFKADEIDANAWEYCNSK